MIEMNERVIFSRLLEERLNDIGGSLGQSMFDGALNVMEGNMVKEYDNLGMTYLLNYQTQRLADYLNLSVYSQSYYPFINMAQKYADDASGTSLKPCDEANPVVNILNNRRSIREYSGTPVTFADISSILNGIQNTHEVGEMTFRNTPSGGGLYPVTIYFHANRIEDIDEGVYRYQPSTNSILLIEKDTKNKIKEIYKNQLKTDLDNYAALFMFVFDYVFCFQKYNDLALSLGLIETGMLAQNLELIANSLGLGTCDIGGCDKVKGEELLKIDGMNQHLIYSVIMGSKKNNGGVQV